MKKRFLTPQDIKLGADSIARHLLELNVQGNFPFPAKAYAVPRGGIPVLYAVQAALTKMTGDWLLNETADPEEAAVVIDDIIDSGATMRRFPWKVPFCVLISKNDLPESVRSVFAAEYDADSWIVFPWEATLGGSADDIVTRLLQFIGEDPTREGLKETPARVIKAWQEWTAGYEQDPVSILKTFEDGAKSVDELILVRDIPMWSHCEHHLAPFFGVAHIGYIPNGRIVGLSKLARLVDVFGRRLQVQERMTNQIADAMQEALAPVGVGVVIEARHMCMESRGIRRVGATTVTSAMRGALMVKPEARAEFFSIINRGRP